MKEKGNRLFPKILVVEDETIIAEDIRMTLMDYGYEVTGVATSGEEAIVKAAETEHDLIIMDIMLSGDITGIEAADEIYFYITCPGPDLFTCFNLLFKRFFEFLKSFS